MPESDGQTLRVRTTRFGEIEVESKLAVTLPNGMVGFPAQQRYVILRHREGSPFHWLQSLDQPDLAFVIVNPLVFDPQYQMTLGGAETKLLEVRDPAQVQVWVVVTIPHGSPEDMTANLKAPLVINLDNGLAAQIILDDPRYPLRQPLKR